MQKEQNVQRHAPTVRGILQAVAILLICAMVFSFVSDILMSKDGMHHVMVFEELKEQAWDVVFAGSSHMNRAMYPMQLWEEQGIASYNNAQNGEIIPVSYHTIKSVIETYHPRMIVLDMYMVYHNKTTGNIKWMHQSLDRLPFINKSVAIVDLLPMGLWMEYFVPAAVYHTRWKELKRSDFTPEGPRIELGASQRFTVNASLGELSYELTPASVKHQIPEVPLRYLEKIVALCKKTGTQLMLVALPYCTSPEAVDATHDMSKDEAYFNWIADYAAENDLHYINFFQIREEIGFEWGKHLFDYSHMNYWGGELVTRYLGQYLADHFDFTDHRGDPAYAAWDAAIPKYHEMVEESIAEAQKK